MSSFLVLVDPDPARREACLRAAMPELTLVQGLSTGRCDCGSFAAIWACGPATPVSLIADAGRAAVLWGNAVPITGNSSGAEAVLASWSHAAGSPPDAWDGYYAGVRYAPQDGLVVGGDRLGIFPVYFWSRSDVVMVSSSQAAFRTHPRFVSGFHPRGLAGILLTGGLLGGETPWRDVRRLSAGHLLRWSSSNGTREVKQYILPGTDELPGRSFDEQVDGIGDGLDRALTRETRPGVPAALMLSGGRDSRLVAGFLQRHGVKPQALTLGEPTDHEARCAAGVAKSLGFPHRIVADPLDEVADLARRQVSAEHLANGMANFFTWGMVPLLSVLGEQLFTGYRIDGLIGGTWRGLSPPADGSVDPVARFQSTASAYGIAPDRLRRLLRPEVFGAAVDECLEVLRDWFTAQSGDADRRAWTFAFYHRGRHHAGGAIWRMGFGSWPVVPVLDRSFADYCAALPLATLRERRAEDALMRRRFPALARLPLDRNSDDTSPLTPSLTQRAGRSVGRLVEAVRRLPSSAPPVVERRRYYRLYDINGPMWQAVRRLAEANRIRAADVLNPAELDLLLPPAPGRIELKDSITDSNGLKALIGFLIWWADHG